MVLPLPPRAGRGAVRFPRGDQGGPFEQTFFDWHGGFRSKERAGRGPSAGLYAASPAFALVAAALEGFEAIDGAGLDRPYFARETPCMLLNDKVEAIWAAIVEGDDWSPLAAKLAEIREMAEAYGSGATAA